MWDYFANASTTELIAVSVFIGATLASIAVFFNKNIIGRVVRALISAGANDPESAKTLDELGMSRNFFVKRALSGGGALRKLVNEADDRVIALPDGSTYFERDKKLDVRTARFYISEEKRVRAEIRYAKKGSDVIILILSIVVYFGVAWGIVVLLPYMFDLFSKVVS